MAAIVKVTKAETMPLGRFKFLSNKYILTFDR